MKLELAGKLIEAAIEVLADPKVNPDEYRKKHGKCPKGYHVDKKTDKCKANKYGHENFKETPLHRSATNGDVGVLQHPKVSKVKDWNGQTPLHHLAHSGKTEVLDHPDVARVKNDYGMTPLHYLALSGKPEVLNHPDAAKIKDDYGRTPLHYLAGTKNWKRALKHPDADRVKDADGKTPKDVRDAVRKVEEKYK